MDPLISVIIPAFNAEATLAETVDSVLEQTYGRVEVVLIDDGSTDGTRDIASACIKKDGRCRYFRYENRGAASARNRGIERSLGILIAFLDADDLWEKEKLQAQLEQMAAKPGAAVLTQIKRFVDSGSGRRYLGTTDPPPYTGREGYIRTLLALSSPEMTSFATVLAKKEYLLKAGLFDERLSTSEDWDLWMRLSRECQFANVQAPLHLYRKHPGSLTLRNGLRNTLDNQLLVIDKIGSLCRIDKRRVASVKARKRLEFAQMSVYGRGYLSALALLARGFADSPADFGKREFVRPLYRVLRSMLEVRPWS